MSNATSSSSPAAEKVVWDLSSYFPSVESKEFSAFVEDFEKRLEAHRSLCAALGPMSPATRAGWVEALLRLEDLMPRFSHLASFIGCLTAADARDEAAQREEARIALLGAAFEKAQLPFESALREASEAEYQALLAEPQLADSQLYLRRARWEATHAMDSSREALAADLAVDGLKAWDRLYDKVAGLLDFEYTDEAGNTQRRPMAQRRGLLENPNPAVRKSVFLGSNKAWQSVEHVTASALNAISGTRLTLYRERGISHFLDQALHDSAIAPETLEAMMGAIEDGVETSRDILRAKRVALGLDKLGFQDLAAPLPVKLQEEYSWADAKKAILQSFEKYPRLRDYCKAAFDNRWVEAEKRNGKRPGAFCTSSWLTRQSRVYMTFNGTVGDVMTLAHELGHAFHNEVMKDLRPLRRRYPMTLAETASTFAEALLVNNLIESPETSATTKAFLLDAGLTHGAAFLLDIPMRFQFEKSLYERRAKGELSVSEIKELMLESQRKLFGDALDGEQLDPYFWTSKLHFYITGVSFYNFPYTFGYLFSRALSQRYFREGPAFAATYERALYATGSESAEKIALEVLGVDIRSRAFWAGVIESHRPEIERYRQVTTHL